jgi:hypothetical protein
MANEVEFSKSQLQQYLTHTCEVGHFAEIILTDEQGLVICTAGEPTDQTEKQAAFFSMIRRVSSNAILEMELSGSAEFSFIDDNGKKLIVRPFEVHGSELILAIYLNKQNSPYKRLINNAIHTIQSVWMN